MTDPTQAKRVRTAGGDSTRKYSWPPQPPHEFTVTSVTSALKSLPKPFLIGWAAKMTAQCAVDDLEIITAMVKKPNGKRAAVDHLKGARYRDMKAKGDRGTIVHAAIDSYLKGKPYTKEEMEAALIEARVDESMWASTAGMAAGVMEFLWDAEIDVLWNEATVYNRTHRYAGTADIIGRLQIGGSVKPAVIDVKTSKAIYDEVALQLCAYACAEFVGLNDGTEAPLIADGEKIEHGVVIRPKADGSYERVDFVLSQPVFEMFLGTVAVTEGSDNNVLGKARRPTVQ